MSEPEYWVWEGEDSKFVGTVQARFQKRSGKAMVALEDDRGLLHVYPDNPARLKKITDPEWLERHCKSTGDTS